VRAGAAVALIGLAAIAACGARTQLNEPPPKSDAGTPPDAATRDGPPPDTFAPDASVPEAGCTSDLQCNDGVNCTIDVCDRFSGQCFHRPDDSICQDGVFCNGDKRCAPAMGCVTTPRNCDDGIACTHDSCDERSRSCLHQPDDSLCPVGFACDPTSGCVARGFAESDTTFYTVRLPSGAVATVGPTGTALDDIALHPNGTVYGVSFGALYTVDPATGNTVFVATENANLNALDAAPDGTLYAAGGSTLYTIDPASGALTYVLTYPNNYASSGDLAIVAGTLLATVTGGGPTDTLLSVDLSTHGTSVIGDTGFTCIWGLAAYGSSLFGFTCGGEVLSIDPASGRATLLTTMGVMFYGASSR
jgi:hypothetical protein